MCVISCGSEGICLSGHLLALKAGKEHRLAFVRRSKLQGGIGHLVVVALGTLPLHNGAIRVRFRLPFRPVEHLAGIVGVEVYGKLGLLAAVNYF